MKVWVVMGSNVMGRSLRGIYAEKEKAETAAGKWERNYYDYADEMIVEEWELIE